MQRLWLLAYDYVEDIVERRGPHREAHLAHLSELHGAGRLLLAAAAGDPPHGALIVLRDREAADEILARDPYVANGLVTAHRVEPLAVPVGG